MNNLELQRLTNLSEFAKTQIKRLDKNFIIFNRDQILLKNLDKFNLQEDLKKKLNECQTESELAHVLRVFRNLHQVRLIYRMINNLADYEQTVKEVSILACVCVQQTYNWLYDYLSCKFAPPVKKDGSRLDLVIIGMGKLGGEELNLSSDIDLIFAYPECIYRAFN